ncbi:hypothetical protein BaRGS_00031666 [Batillaria attramentaria]|uniref:Uncharacterized protein n=1 Tax=Batillaria attramentaria TaxID=370345 RepID=A0ABD0JPW8_9CAEN
MLKSAARRRDEKEHQAENEDWVYGLSTAVNPAFSAAGARDVLLPGAPPTAMQRSVYFTVLRCILFCIHRLQLRWPVMFMPSSCVRYQALKGHFLCRRG